MGLKKLLGGLKKQHANADVEQEHDDATESAPGSSAESQQPSFDGSLSARSVGASFKKEKSKDKTKESKKDKKKDKKDLKRHSVSSTSANVISLQLPAIIQEKVTLKEAEENAARLKPEEKSRSQTVIELSSSSSEKNNTLSTTPLIRKFSKQFVATTTSTEETSKQKEQVVTRHNRARSYFRRTEISESLNATPQEVYSTPSSPSNTASDIGAPIGFLEVFTPQLIESYVSLRNLAHQLNVQLPIPEYVFVGKKGCGKSTLIESLLGYACNAIAATEVSSATSSPTHSSVLPTTRKPIVYHLIHNSHYKQTPKFSLRYPPLQCNDISLIELNNKLNECLQDHSSEPIFILIEHAYFMDMNLIDSPGIHFEDYSNTQESVLQTVLDLIAPPHRHIIAVEEPSSQTDHVADWKILSIIKEVDPHYARTTLVCNKFHFALLAMDTCEQLHRYTQHFPLPTWFVSCISYAIRNKSSHSVQEWNHQLMHSYKRDVGYWDSLMQQLQYQQQQQQLQQSNYWRERMGIFAWRNHTLSHAHGIIANSMAEIWNQIKSRIRFVEMKQKQPFEKTSQQLRQMATEYVTQFSYQMERIVLHGTMQANAKELGQTVFEEGTDQWTDDAYTEMTLQKDHSQLIPFFDQKLYGGQQLKRCFTIFKYICQQLHLDEHLMDDTSSTVAMSPILMSEQKMIWTAAEWTSQKLKHSLKHLTRQLIQKCLQMMKRIPLLMERILGYNQNQHLILFVKYLYWEHVETMAKQLETKLCANEFFEARAIYQYALFEHLIPSQSATSLVQTSQIVFTSIRDWCVNNIICKVMDGWIVPLSQTLLHKLLQKVCQLTEEELTCQVFQYQQMKQEYELQQNQYKKELQLLLEQESIFVEQGEQFKQRKTNHSSTAAATVMSKKNSMPLYSLFGLATEEWNQQQQQESTNSPTTMNNPKIEKIEQDIKRRSSFLKPKQK